MNRAFSELKEKILQKRIKVSVVGLGYVGLPLALEFAKNGFYVFGIEVDKDRISYIRRGESYITDVSTKELKNILATGRFMAVGDFKVIGQSECIIICVPTPLKRKHYPDITYIKQAVQSISENIKSGSIVILESTTYPGTTEEVILPLLERNNLSHNRDFFLCFSPERIDPGNISYPVKKIPKILGGLTRQATELGMLVYKNIIDKVVPVSSTRTAEAVKLLESTFRLINIGMIDEMAMMADKMNINIWEVIEAAKTKPFGFMPFFPGPGVGGHCIGKDPLYLYWKAEKFGFKSRFIRLASEIINNMPGYVVKRIKRVLSKNRIKLNKAKVLVVGVTYKKDVKDLRKSPALDIIGILQKNNSAVSYYDPLIPYLKFRDINLKSINLDKKYLDSFDCTVIATDHSAVDYEFILQNARLIFDARNVYKGITSNKIIRL